MTNILSKFSITVGVAFAMFLAMTLTAHAATVPLSTIHSGDLIRGSAYSSVYYFGEDGMRYVFPNDKIYFTWYPDFKNVKWISDDDLTKIQIGGNVTYKPGVKMIKITSDPRVYVVSKGGVLRTIISETVAKELYGDVWNKKIDDLPDGFFSNYSVSGKIDFSSQYSASVEQKYADSINTDKMLFPATIVHVTDTGYNPPTIHVISGRAVRFVNNGTQNHSVTEWDHVWGSGTLRPGDTFTKYFVEKGTWSYYSTYDSKTSVGGAIVVE